MLLPTIKLTYIARKKKIKEKGDGCIQNAVPNISQRHFVI